MAVTTTTVDAAITAIQDSGQSFTIDGMSYSQANLSALLALRKQLRDESARSVGTRPTFRAFNLGSASY